LLTEAVMRSAQSLGAELACPARFIAAAVAADGCHVRYAIGALERECHATVLVNAAGPWVNEVVAAITPPPPTVPINLVQGSHIVLPAAATAFTGDNFYYVESPRDGRAVFIMPREGRLVVGTTETRFRGNPDNVQPHPAEETYLLSVLRHYFPDLKHLTRRDLLGSWAGLRVLPGGGAHAFHKSRETILQCDRPAKPRVLTIYGGKLTTYRTTAAKVLTRIESSLPDVAAVAATAELPLTLD